MLTGVSWKRQLRFSVSDTVLTTLLLQMPASIEMRAFFLRWLNAIGAQKPLSRMSIANSEVSQAPSKLLFSPLICT